jgi:DNA-directed RNA polymerase specialized sigma24 family protein
MLITEFAATAAKEAFKELTPSQKKVWRLCRQKGLSEEKAGCVLAISRDAVHQRLICAEKKFKKHLTVILKADEDSNEG